MFLLAVLCVTIGGASPRTSSDSVVIPTAPVDTPRTRPKVIEVSDWYGRRLTIHRWVAYATIPVFAVQWAAGDRLYKHGADAPTWAKTTHRVGATGSGRNVHRQYRYRCLELVGFSRSTSGVGAPHRSCSDDARRRRRVYLCGRQAR